MADKKAQLIIEGAAPIELPVYSGTMGPDVVDVRGLTAQGVFTFDPGFMATSSCESKITYIDGDKGVLLHRGYPIDQLAEKSDFLETCFLLLKGELPSAEEKAKFDNLTPTPQTKITNMTRPQTAWNRKRTTVADLPRAMGVR